MFEGNVYFARPIGMIGPIKIGHTIKPRERLPQIAAWSPFPLEFAYVEESPSSLEGRLHKCFADCHSHLEWFHPVPRLVDAIKELQSGKIIREVIDLDDIRGTIDRMDTDERLNGKRSVVARLKWAEKRAERIIGCPMKVPFDVSEIMDRWSCTREDMSKPTFEELCRITEVTDNPDVHCVPA